MNFSPSIHNSSKSSKLLLPFLAPFAKESLELETVNDQFLLSPLPLLAQTIINPMKNSLKLPRKSASMTLLRWRGSILFQIMSVLKKKLVVRHKEEDRERHKQIDLL